MESGTIEAHLPPLEVGVARFKRVDISDDVWQKVKNGMRLEYNVFQLDRMPTEEIPAFLS